MHKCQYIGRLEVKRGKLWHTVRAFYKGDSLDVLRTCMDGRQESRNLYFRNVFGYGVTFPGDRENMGYGYGFTRSILEPWGKTLINVDPCVFESVSSIPDEKDRAAVLELYPDFKWIMKKHPMMSRGQILRLLPIWEKDHKVELLLDAGFRSMAFNKSFYRLTEPKRRAVLDFLRKHPGYDWSLTEVQTIMAEGITLDQYNVYANYCSMAGKRVSYKVYEYLSHIPVRPWVASSTYRDYIAIAKKCGHNVKDPYWAYPKSLTKAHDKVLREWKNIQAAQEIEKQKRKQEAYTKAVKKWIEKELQTAGGVRVYVPGQMEDIIAQANALNQCLVACDYAQKVINKNCVLVFIVKGNKRMATAEILPDGTVGQFYGNEANRDRCKPSKTAREALDQWKQTFLKAA